MLTSEAIGFFKISGFKRASVNSILGLTRPYLAEFITTNYHDKIWLTVCKNQLPLQFNCN